jgi:large subunit ribosomal protein L14
VQGAHHDSIKGTSLLFFSHDDYMLINQSILNCIDNSGAALVECALVIGQKNAARIGTSRINPAASKALTNSPGDRIVVVVKEHRAASASGMAGISSANKVRRGDIRHAVVVRTKYPTQRPDGSQVTFSDNACVLLNKSGDPVGSRINGVVAQELKKKKWSKILSMAPMNA